MERQSRSRTFVPRTCFHKEHAPTPRRSTGSFGLLVSDPPGLFQDASAPSAASDTGIDAAAVGASTNLVLPSSSITSSVSCVAAACDPYCDVDGLDTMAHAERKRKRGYLDKPSVNKSG
ncbi:hypothetical protein FVE85_6175 [Porphyridium purpureum]|uniref:Uncharacterized protein n=1 Tax=Porphyridium purpureum TaxID=35688 RepID=A0A5J4Z5R8_PORPP|nr:hypothetical protein FVE85_6175 [Porphyridium purpureum]|eukprot:POR2388..scf295_1